MAAKHYLEKELYELIQKDVQIFQIFQDGSLYGIWYWDLEKPEHEWLSPRFWKILGYNPREMKHLASEWQDLINQDDLQVALDNFKKHCEDANHPYDQVVRYTAKDGSTVWVRCRGMAIRDKEGKPIRMLGAHTDLTPLKRTEEELRKRTAELEDALAHIKTLRGFLPICSMCKKILDDKGYWTQIEQYVRDHSDATFSHGICPDCLKEHYPDLVVQNDEVQ